MSDGCRGLLLAVGACLVGPYLTLRLTAEAICAADGQALGTSVASAWEPPSVKPTDR